MENDDTPALQSEAPASDATQHELTPGIRLIVAHERPGDAQTVADEDPNSTLEIIVDGSDLLHGGGGRDGLELSIMFEKNNEEEGLQSELADQLDGVEVKVSLDSTHTMGVEVLSSFRGDHGILHHEELQLAVENPHRDARVGDAGAHALPAPNGDDQIVENDLLMENCVHALPAINSGEGFPDRDDVKEDYALKNRNKGDGNQGNEKKRPRDDLMTDNDRCLKSKTLEHNEIEELEKISSNIMDAQEYAEPLKPCLADISAAINLHTEIGAENFGIDKIGFQETKAFNGLNTDDNACNKESTEKAIDARVDESVRIDENVCDKDNTSNDKGGRERPRKRRKIAMLLAYCGAGYQGMQKNPGALTIEGELEQALAKAGAMPENFDGNPRKVDWMRAARTDKGVSAVGQVVSGMFYVEPPGFVERVNAHLPQPIRLLGFKRVIPTFSAKKFCDRRRYEYVIPTFALDPSAHRDREAVLASEGTEGVLNKCLECSERGRKVPARKAPDNLLPNTAEISVGNMFDGQKSSTNGIVTVSEMPSISEQPHEETISVELKSSTATESADSALDLENEGANQISLDEQPETVKKSFHFGEADRMKLNRLLNYYVGTHNFHNFTSRVKAEDPSAKRYMVSFEASDVFTVGNMEFVRCTVVGQSFMLHQIRKMIGLVIAVFRGCAPESIIETALRRDANITIPTAPELGLFLDECMYPAYNQKWYNTHEEVSQKGYEAEISSFKHVVIYEHIAATEHKEGQMALFLHSLNDRNYADFATAREAEKQPVP